MENQFTTYLQQVSRLLVKHESSPPSKVLASNDVHAIYHTIAEDLPSRAENFEAVLDDFSEKIYPYINYNTSPEYAAYITGGGNKIGALAELLKAYFNQNSLKWNSSPIACEVEKLVLSWIADFIHQPAHHHGFLTSGGSMSNLLAIHFALANACPDREMDGISSDKHYRIYCSDQTHSSIERSTVFLGLGRNAVVKISSKNDFTIDTVALDRIIDHDKRAGYTPLMIIGNAGTTNTGSIDDLKTLADLAQKYDIWFHVDGAYGLPAIRLDELKEKFDGTEHADSITINPHKWMYVPFEASCILHKNPIQAINFTPDYLYDGEEDRWESSSQTIELSKEFRALKIWFTLKYFGADQLTKFVQQDIDLVDYMAEILDKNPAIEVYPTHPLSIMCFRYVPSEDNQAINDSFNWRLLRAIESDGRVFLTGTKLNGNTYLRIYFGHPERTTADVDYLVDTIDEIAKKLTTKL